jgi:hypothetical protein
MYDWIDIDVDTRHDTPKKQEEILDNHGRTESYLTQTTREL